MSFTSSGFHKAPHNDNDYRALVDFSDVIFGGKKKDPGGMGFMDEIGESVKGFVSCTETLGFESSDERSSTDESSSAGDLGSHNGYSSSAAAAAGEPDPYSSMERRQARLRSSKELVRREKRFPPPLASLNRLGQPSFILRPVRTDGRLELKVVRFHRPETLCASRENGRLTLHLVRDIDDVEQEGEDEEEPEFEDHAVDTEEKEEEEEEVAILMKVEEEEEREIEVVSRLGDEWKLPVNPGGVGGGGEGVMRRCYEDLNAHRHHHPHHLRVWRQHCVTTG